MEDACRNIVGIGLLSNSRICNDTIGKVLGIFESYRSNEGNAVVNRKGKQSLHNTNIYITTMKDVQDDR